MVDPIFIEGKTIISGNAVYWLDGADLDYIKNKNIAICDDVISTGGTIKSVLHLLEKAQIKPKYIVCALTEGIERKEIYGLEVITCGHFPLPGENND
jgi:adenine phosphoribosyltransferase